MSTAVSDITITETNSSRLLVNRRGTTMIGGSSLDVGLVLSDTGRGGR